MTQKKKNSIITNVAVAIATLLAWVSGYFVMQIVYNSMAASIVFGTVWAIIVFCECRFSHISLKSEGKIEITRNEIKNNLWQIIAAMLVALLVAIPIELKLFVNRIVVSETDLGMQLKSLAEMFPTHWVPMIAIALVIVTIYQLPIFIKMASKD